MLYSCTECPSLYELIQLDKSKIMFGQFHVVIFCAVLTFTISERIDESGVVRKLHVGPRSCPCSSPSYCNPITAADRKEVGC